MDKGKGKESLSRAALGSFLGFKRPETRATSTGPPASTSTATGPPVSATATGPPASAATATGPSTSTATATGPPASMVHKVWYIVVDSDNIPFGNPLSVYLDHNDDIERLMTCIKEGAYKERLAQVNITEMEVWKCKSLTLLGIRPVEIRELVRNLKLSYDKDSDGREVGGWTQITELSLQECEPLIVRVLHKAKRKREDDDYLEDARLSKLAHYEPSKVNSASIYESLQESRQDRILDDCPKPDSDLPPLPLLYSGFGEFRDFINNSANYPIAFPNETEVDELVGAMCFLGYEKDKRARTQDLLHRIFAGPHRKFKYGVDNGTQASTDGHLSASHGGPLLILEFKRLVTFAEGQLANYFLRLSLKSVQDIFYGWRQPALGIIVRGTFISFVGLVMIDTQVRVLPLSHPFVCNDQEIPDRVPLYATFEAARRLLARIEQDAERLVTSPPPFISGSCRRLPDVRSLLRVSGDNGQVEERIGFQITQMLETGLEGKRLLYLATTDRDQTQILIKFSRWYSKELHQFCASVQHAPKLLAFERLPGGWFGVAMEYFPSANRILESEDLRDHGENWVKDIENVVEQFHAQGYVHGDLRPPNFIVNDGKLFLIDFDWGGKEGEATFPRKQLHSILRASREDRLITKERDRRTMRYTTWHISDAIERAS